MTDNNDIRENIKKRYSQVATKRSCCTGASGCCQTSSTKSEYAKLLGYTEQELATAPDEANMNLGCGNPQAISQLKPGEVVLDLGCGGGFDCFLAAKQVGSAGKVIGVDMTPDMIAKANANAYKMDCFNVEFRLGEIEKLPVSDSSVNVIISNCVINLSPEKYKVFREAHRVLQPNGRLAISDVVATALLPDEIKQNMDAHGGCVAGAALVSDIREMLYRVGFSKVSIKVIEESAQFIKKWFPGTGIEKHVRSAEITAVK